MDQGIGRIIDALDETGELENTLIVFLSDNGGCAEDIPEDVTPSQLVEDLDIARYKTRDGRDVRIGNDRSIMPGGEDTYQSYETAWANLSNAPFRLYKHWVHEGGISTPLIMHWPAGIAEPGGLRHGPGQLPDIMATVLEVTGAQYPTEFDGHAIPPCEGESMAASFASADTTRGPLFWEHEGNAAVRDGKWKLVRRFPDDWELYDMDEDRTELNDIVADHPERRAKMLAQYQAWADRCGVIPREQILRVMADRNENVFWEKSEET
jgi:arylsulfatase A-like enzyme